MFLLYLFVDPVVFLLWSLLMSLLMRLIATILESLDSRKAKGVDGIPAQFLKACPFGIAGLLAPLLNRCLRSSVFPILWKCAVVSPVQKSLQNFELTKFCPISVLPSCLPSERIVYNQLVAYLNK